MTDVDPFGPSSLRDIYGGFKCGFNRWMQRLAEIVLLVCRSLVFFGDVR
jgi:hypothetical protein